MRSFMGILAVALMVVVWGLGGIGCSDIERSNPSDPRVSGGVHLVEQLVGSWSLDEGDENQVYIFRTNGGVQLHSYSAPDGGLVDRNAAFPQTRVLTFTGTYRLDGRTLTFSFTSAQSNDPSENPLLPRTEEVVRVSIARNTLTLEGNGRKRSYLRQ